MSYSNDQTQIRAGLVNYIGSLLKTSHYEGKVGRQNVAAILVEEAIKLSQDENNVVDLYVAKPMISGIVYVLNQRINELSNSKLPKNQVSTVIEEYKKMVDTFNNLLKTLQ
jgi:hypothetical protein